MAATEVRASEGEPGRSGVRNVRPHRCEEGADRDRTLGRPRSGCEGTGGRGSGQENEKPPLHQAGGFRLRILLASRRKPTGEGFCRQTRKQGSRAVNSTHAEARRQPPRRGSLPLIALIPPSEKIYCATMVTGFDCADWPVTGSVTVITTGTALPGVTPDGT